MRDHIGDNPTDILKIPTNNEVFSVERVFDPCLRIVLNTLHTARYINIVFTYLCATAMQPHSYLLHCSNFRLHCHIYRKKQATAGVYKRRVKLNDLSLHILLIPSYDNF